MISVCIPVYNFDINPLVRLLEEEIMTHNLPCEIILIDDCSNEEFRGVNKRENSTTKYIQLAENIGRAKIRNLFLNYVLKDFLLFLDCDSRVITKDFLRKYLLEVEKSNDVVCGGRVYPTEFPEKAKRLRWKYGIEKESKTALERSKHPNKSFMTNNFLIKKSLLEKIQFDERLTNYGHEDTLFGIELNKAGILICHIENPILNGDIETNAVFLDKTEKAIENLVLLNRIYSDSAQLTADIQLLHIANKWKAWNGVMRINHYLFGGLIKRLLTKGWISLTCFDIYKLGYFLVQSKNK